MKYGASALVGVASFGLYLTTLAPTVTFVDSGELILAAREPGVAHPPGFPVYTLLAHAATWLPFGSVAERVHLVSALFAAFAAAIVTLLVQEMAPAVMRTRQGRRGRQAAAARPDPRLAPAAAAAAGLLFASSRTLWSYATIAEVYTLTIALVAAVLLLLVRWRQAVLAAGPDEPVHQRSLYGAAACYGLALGVHHVTVGLMTPAFVLLLASTTSVRRVDRTVWLRSAGCLLAALAAYLYLPLAAAADPLVNWGDPGTARRFWWHVTGRQYQVFLSFSFDTMVGQVPSFVQYVTREFGPARLPVALLLAAAGAVHLRRSDRTLAMTLLLVVLANVAYALNYDIAEDKDAYYLPTFVALAVAAGLGAARALALVAASGAARIGGLLVAAVIAAAPVSALAANWRFNDRSRYSLAHDYVTNVLSTIEPGGMLLTREWQYYSPWWYVRHVEGLRPDVVTIDVNLLRRTWYFDYLEREYPATMRAARPEVQAFLEDLAHWELDPARYERDVGLNIRINTRFYDMIMAIVDAHLRSGAVYVTQDLLSPDEELAGRLAAFQRVPQGLVFQVTRDQGVVRPAEPALEMRGLFDGTLAFEPDDVVRMKVAPVYVGMLVNRGRYLATHGLADRARALYTEALRLDPGNPAARASLDALGGVPRRD